MGDNSTITGEIRQDELAAEIALGKACRRGKMGEFEGVNLFTASPTS
jgi:hypothetical protein